MKELSFADVSRHFHLPLTQAADRLNVSVTLVKHICRENGVSRWPFRKLQSRMKRERIARKDPPPAASCHAAAAEAMTAAAGMDAELAAADVQQSQLLEHYLASLVDFVDSIDSDPLDLSERSSTFGSMVDQTLEGAHLRGWNSFAADLERYGGLAISPIDDGVTAAAVTAARSPAAHAEAPSDAQQPTTPTAATTGDGSSDGSLGERGKTRRVRKGKVFSFADVSRNFHLPLTLAAEQLNVSVTLVKRVCRENGVSRWPYRKLQSRKKKERIAHEAAVQHGGGGGGSASMAPPSLMCAANGGYQVPVYISSQAGASLHPPTAWMPQVGTAGGRAWLGPPTMHQHQWPVPQ